MASYEKLERDSLEEDSNSSNETLFQSPSRLRLSTHTLAIISSVNSLLVIILTVLLLFSYSGFRSSSRNSQLAHQPSEDLILDCGSSKLDALKNGCTFNIMANAWLPQLCYDAEAANAALSPASKLAQIGGAGTWPWFADQNFTIPKTYMELTEPRDGEVVGGWTWETYHAAHCLYDWSAGVKAMNRVLSGERNVYVHSAVVNAPHIDHCNFVLADQKNRVRAKTHVKFGYGKCVRLDV